MYFTHIFFSQSTFLWDRRRKSRIGMGFYRMCRISEADKWRLKSGASLTFLEPCWTRKLGKTWNQDTCALLHTAWSTAEVGMGSPDLRVTQTSYSGIPCTLFPTSSSVRGGRQKLFCYLAAHSQTPLLHWRSQFTHCFMCPEAHVLSRWHQLMSALVMRGLFACLIMLLAHHLFPCTMQPPQWKAGHRLRMLLSNPKICLISWPLWSPVTE